MWGKWWPQWHSWQVKGDQGVGVLTGSPRSLLPLPPQVFVNFAKKQSDNLEQQETSPSCALQSPLERVLSLLRPRAAPTELRALVVEEQEDLETDDEGLISFEEERVRGCPQIWVSLVPAVSLPWGTGTGCHGTSSHPGKGTWWVQGWSRGGVAAPPRLDPGPSSPGQPLPSPEPCVCARRLSSRSTRTRCAEALGAATSPSSEATSPFWPLPSLCPIERSRHGQRRVPGRTWQVWCQPRWTS